MYRLDLKPLSVNDAYRGRRFATEDLTRFKKDAARLLPRLIEIPDGKLWVKYRFGVSSKNNDADNLVKALQDCIAEMYHFNDKRIYRIEVEKEDVKKGAEYCQFVILPM